MFSRIKDELALLYSTKAQSLNGKRITYLDMVRGIAIFLVVVGHSGLIGHEHNVWLSTFHLPAFFVVSGILMQIKKEDEQSIGTVIKRKIKGVMLPYLWFSLGSLLVIIIQVLRGKLTWEVPKELIVQTIGLQGYSVMWFLPVLLLSELFVLLLFKSMNKIIKKKMVLILISIVITAGIATVLFYAYHFMVTKPINSFVLGEFRTLTKTSIASVLIAFGYLIGIVFAYIKKQPKEDGKGLKAWLRKFDIIGLVVGAILFAVNFIVVPYIQIMDLNNVNLHNLFVYWGLGICGSLGLLLICKSIPNIPIITFYGQNSLIVMCTHLNFYVLNAGMIIGRDVIEPLPGPDGLQFMLGSIVFTMLLEIPVILIVRIFFPFVLGRKYPSRKQKENNA